MEQANTITLEQIEFLKCNNCQTNNSTRRKKCTSCGCRLPEALSIKDWLLQFESSREWLNTLNSPPTMSAYCFHLATFCRFHKGLTPDSLVKSSQQQMRKMVLDYLFHLKKVAKPRAGKKIANGELSVNSIDDYAAGIRSFLNFHEITLPWKKFSSYMPAEVESGLRNHTTEEVVKLAKFADVHDKPIVYTAMSGGVRRGAMSLWSSETVAATITFKNIIPIPDEIYHKLGVDPFGLAFIDIYTDSKDDHYQSLMTPEAYIVSMEYKNYRIQHGEKITPDSFLIRDKFAPLSRATNKPHAITGNSLDDRMRRLHNKAGIALDHLQPVHGLRHFFSTKVRAAKVDKDVKRLLMGQTSDLDDTYDNVNDPDYQLMVVGEYMKAIDILTINPEFKMQKRIKQLEQQLKDAPKLEVLQNDSLNKSLEIDALKRRMEEKDRKHDQDMKDVREMFAKLAKGQIVERTEEDEKRLSQPPAS